MIEQSVFEEAGWCEPGRVGPTGKLPKAAHVMACTDGTPMNFCKKSIYDFVSITRLVLHKQVHEKFTATHLLAIKKSRNQ